MNGIPARRSAAWMLERVIADGKLISELVAQGGLDRLAPDDRARAQRLAKEVLQNLETADRLIAAHASKAPPLPVRNLLRLGAVELANGTAAHGVVNDLVTLASRSKKHARLKGLVNAVLRKLAASVAEDWPKQPTPRMPAWLRGPLVEAWGKRRVAGMERAHHAGAPLDLSLKTPGLSLPLDGDHLPTGSFRVRNAGQITALAGYDKGDWWVQDAAAAIPAHFVRGERVLDLCAAPGGKTMQLAAMGKTVTAVDISDNRLARLRENLERTGLEADIEVADAFSLEGQWDSVLLDAPCSATGTIRRHPDLPYAKDGAEFAALIEGQAAMLDHALKLVPPGGQVVFCTCSILPDEGEVQIEEVLARHPGLEIDADAMDLPWIEPEWRSVEGGLRLTPDMWPERGGLDGFYFAALRKPV